MLVFYVISALLGKKKSNLIEKGVNNIIQGTTDVKGNQDAMVSAVNGLIDGYNAMGQKYEQYGKFEGARDKYVVAAVTQSTAILEILYTVYANSKNVPQGVKDLVNLKYASCLKQIGDDKELMAIVESIRHIIGGSDEPPEEEEKTE